MLDELHTILELISKINSTTLSNASIVISECDSNLLAKMNRSTIALLESIKNSLSLDKRSIEYNMRDLDTFSKNNEKFPLYFQSNRQNLDVRICKFLKYKYINKKSKYLNYIYNAINTRLNLLEELILKFRVFTESSMLYIEVIDEHGLLHVEDNKLCAKNVKIDLLLSEYKKYRLKIDKFSIPAYISDFKSYYAYFAKICVSLSDEGVGYVATVNEEVNLTRYFFDSPSAEGKFIDELLLSCEQTQFNNLTESFVNGFRSSTFSTYLQSENEKALVFQVIYRLVLERCYESLFRSLRAQYSNKCVGKDFGEYTFQEAIPFFRLVPFPPESKVKMAMLYDPHIRDAIDFLSITNFLISPVDILYNYSVGVGKTRRACSILRLGAEYRQDDSFIMASFEEVLAINVAVMISSDIFDIFKLGHYLDTLISDSPIVPFLDFTYTSLKAAIQYMIEFLECHSISEHEQS